MIRRGLSYVAQKNPTMFLKDFTDHHDSSHRIQCLRRDGSCFFLPQNRTEKKKQINVKNKDNLIQCTKSENKASCIYFNIRDDTSPTDGELLNRK